MKVERQPPTPPALLGAVAAPSTESFGEVLAAQAQASGAAPAVAEFGALGMFGRRSTVSSEAAASLASQAQPPARPSARTDDAAAALPVDTPEIPEARVQMTGRTGRGFARTALPVRTPASTAQAAPGEAGDAWMSGAPLDGADAADGELSAHAPRAHTQRARPTATANDHVRLLADAGVARVAVSTAGLSPDEADRFHERAEGLLREHGLSLRSLTVNGRALADHPSGRTRRPWR